MLWMVPCINLTLKQDHDPLAERRVPRVADRQDEYRARARDRVISPERIDPFMEGTVDSDFVTLIQ